VVMSEKGWIRTLKGKMDDFSGIKFKEGDKLAFAAPAETTDKIIVFATNGKFYTLGADKLPGGRGHGEPIRLLVDMENDHNPIGMFVHNPERELIVASSEGYGFRVSESEIIASTRGGRKTLNVKGDSEAIRVIQVKGDKIATIGENRKKMGASQISRHSNRRRGFPTSIHRHAEMKSPIGNSLKANVRKQVVWRQEGSHGNQALIPLTDCKAMSYHPRPLAEGCRSVLHYN